MHEQRITHAHVCGDGTAKISGQQDCAEDGCAWQQVQHDTDELHNAEHDDRIRRKSQLSGSATAGANLRTLLVESKSRNAAASPVSTWARRICVRVGSAGVSGGDGIAAPFEVIQERRIRQSRIDNLHAIFFGPRAWAWRVPKTVRLRYRWQSVAEVLG